MTDNRGIGPKTALPGGVAEHCHGLLAPGPIIVGGEGPADGGLHTEAGEVVPRDQLPEHQLSLRAQLEGEHRQGVADNAIEASALSPKIVEVGKRHGNVTRCLVGLGAVDADQSIGLAHRERLEQHRVDDAEHRRVQADADRQGGKCGECERAMGDQLAQRIAGVGGETVHESSVPPAGHGRSAGAWTTRCGGARAAPWDPGEPDQARHLNPNPGIELRRAVDVDRSICGGILEQLSELVDNLCLAPRMQPGRW